MLPASAPGFDAPLAMLRACHGRIEQQLEMLARLCPHLRLHGWDRDARLAAEHVIRYFTSAALHHHQDEEQDLFPLLLGHDPALDKLIETLRAEHDVLRQAWQELHVLLTAHDPDTRLLDTTVARFQSLYRDHIAQENTVLLPAAAARLTPAQKQQLSEAMAERRGTPYQR